MCARYFQLQSIFENQIVQKLNANENFVKFVEESNGFENLNEYLKKSSNTAKAIIPLIIQGLLDKIKQKYQRKYFNVRHQGVFPLNIIIDLPYIRIHFKASIISLIYTNQSSPMKTSYLLLHKIVSKHMSLHVHYFNLHLVFELFPAIKQSSNEKQNFVHCSAVQM